MKALKITVSGSYKTANGDIVDFEDVQGAIPFIEEEYAKMHVRSRYASEWVRDAAKEDGSKMYPQRIDQMRQIFIDEIEVFQRDFSFIGKDIKKMSYEELQDLATLKDLRTVPLPKKISGVDIREMREKAYLEYSSKVLGSHIDVQDPEPHYSSKVGDKLQFDFAKLPALFVEDTEQRIETSAKVTNDEILDVEMKARNINEKTPKANITLNDLKAVAKQKGIEYHWNVGFDKLYDMIYGSGTAS